MKKEIYQFLLVVLCLTISIVGCSTSPYAATESFALKEWPGGLSDEHFDSYQLLLEQEISEGKVLFYAHGSNQAPTNSLCATVTFLTPTYRGWTAQASGNPLGCRADYPNPKEFLAAYTIGGNVTPISSVFGFVHHGETLQIVWSDDVVSKTPVQNGYFLFARPVNLSPKRVELLDANGNILEVKEMCTITGICT